MAKALIVVDVQNDFCEGGSLPVTGGNEVARRILTFIVARDKEYEQIVFTLDWHKDPGQHWVSVNQEPNYVDIWPVHCKAETEGARLNPVFLDKLPSRTVYFQKGQQAAAYSGFEGTHWATGTPLLEWLRLKGIDKLDICGIATDYCVAATVLDALDNKFEVHVLTDLIAAVDPQKTGPDAIHKMVDNGAKLVESAGA